MKSLKWSKKWCLYLIISLSPIIVLLTALTWSASASPFDTEDIENSGIKNLQESEDIKPILEQVAINLLYEQLHLQTIEHSINISNTIILDTSARIDIALITTGSEVGEIEEIIHVFALHNNKQILQIFREPSPEFYLYADQVSPSLLSPERLNFWKNLKESEERSGMGSENQIMVINSNYKLPWTGGARYPITTNYDNKHFDFSMVVGNQIRAARGGEVFVQRANSDGGCCDYSCNDLNNYVRITHSDGTYGFYLHLQFNSITVNTGDTVNQGACLGKSGNTGYSCGPHLHFNVSTTPSNDGGNPYGSAWETISFTEGSIPAPGGYTPYSQNSSIPCGSVGCCGCTATVQNLVGRATVSPFYQHIPLPTDLKETESEFFTELSDYEPVLENEAVKEDGFIFVQEELSALNSPPAQKTSPIVFNTDPPNSASYTVSCNVMGMGGGNLGSANYTVSSTIGQPYATSPITSNSYQVHSGFETACSGESTGLIKQYVYLPMIVR